MKGESTAVANALRAGVALSFILLVVGLALALAHPAATPLSPRQLPGMASAIRTGDAAMVIHIGILVLLLTPFARVVVLVAQFARQRDLSFVFVSFGVLLLLITTILVGLFWEAP